MKKLIAALALCIAGTAVADVYNTGAPRSTNNDDSCDIALLPAATLLLPYFEVDLNDVTGNTTLFSITNVGNTEQIAHVTLWSAQSYPVIAFDIYLTGYDVQSINLYDVIKRGEIAPRRGTGTMVSQLGDFSDDNPTLDLTACERIAADVAPALVTRMQAAFTGKPIDGCRIGEPRAAATGYATIDVVNACNSQLTPADAAYYQGTLRYDNVLIGDYVHTHHRRGRAQASPMVHIRAIPEGGTAATRAADPLRYSVNFPRTFYGRFLPGVSKVTDARQPLPSRFAARWIDGGPGSFETDLVIWREGGGANATCADYADRRATEMVTFDEDENASSFYGVCPPADSSCVPFELTLPSASRISVDDDGVFPLIEANSGWIYLNLDNPDDAGASQAWVVSSMRAQDRFAVDADVVALGNGCSRPEIESEIKDVGGVVIGPSRDVNP